ncbi:uncharacterized protein LOC114953738 [Acropora millepora]|uniref:uncharacterized protein LOC114953738 n=1 Tax=Acropora millepora TaxID=45264 RepID=UPI001CF46012|nr:uncharacterized protein LOC114953738 [Acropora millepora]
MVPDEAHMMPDDQQGTLQDPHILVDDFFMAQKGDHGEYEDEQGAHIVPEDQDEVPDEDQHEAREDRHMLADDLYMEQEDDYSGYEDEDEDEEDVLATGDGSGNHVNVDEEDKNGKESSSHEERATFEEHDDELNELHPYSMPQSDIRWRSLTMAHVRRRDSPVNSYHSKRKGRKRGASPVEATLVTFIVAGGLLIVLLMTAFFIFAWPIRKYYRYLNHQLDEDVEAGWYQNDELQSIQVVPNYPPAPYYNIPIPPPPPPPKIRKRYRKRASTRISYAPSRVVQTEVSRGEGRVKFKSQAEIIADDRKRDARNAERRKIIKRETEPRRKSFVDSLVLARGIIGGYSSNKPYEKKAKERRNVIKRTCEVAQSRTGHQKRKMSFSEELQLAKDVVTPRWDYRQSMVRSLEKCRNLRDQFADRRRPSLQEQIGAAKEVIVESERRKRCIPEELLWEMLAANRAPAGICSYYSVALEEMQREHQEYLASIGADVHEVASSMSELLRGEVDATKASSGESQRMIENEILWL